MKASELDQCNIEKYYPSVARMVWTVRAEIIDRDFSAAFGYDFDVRVEEHCNRADKLTKGEMFFFAIGRYQACCGWNEYCEQEQENQNRREANESIYWL